MLTRTGQSIVEFGVCTESEKMNSRFISVDNIGKLAIFGTSYNLRGPEHVLLASNFRFSAFSFSVFCFWIRLAFVDFSSVHRERICLRWTQGSVKRKVLRVGLCSFLFQDPRAFIFMRRARNPSFP